MPNWNLGIDPVRDLGWPRITDYGDNRLARIERLSPFHQVSVREETLELWEMLLDELVPHIPGGLLRVECWGYTDKPLFHGSGLALDLNASHNPRVSNAGQLAHGEYALPAYTDDIVRKYGCRWGGMYGPDLSGNNKGPDGMHIEMHLYPYEVAGWTKRLRDERNKTEDDFMATEADRQDLAERIAQENAKKNNDLTHDWTGKYHAARFQEMIRQNARIIELLETLTGTAPGTGVSE